MDRPKLLGYTDAANFLGISHQRFNYIISRYNIPFQKTSSGRIFFEEDIVAFQQARKDKLKHRRK
ncbi:MAG: hypothetical protein GKR88_02120 [Flavobacteriaceae bacterium]|nr:MAG: hypothetical protein GKR88_02120 [Flavobacteriaceae bacterium]